MGWLLALHLHYWIVIPFLLFLGLSYVATVAPFLPRIGKRSLPCKPRDV